MLIKNKDSSEKAIRELEAIRQLPNLPVETRTNAEKELKTLRAGERGEKDAAYYIDLYYRKHENWAVFHDLRIEHDGDVAQIDHLLINRLLEFYILETKSFAYGIKINERGEFLRWNGHHYNAIPSPIEQLKRHIYVLERLLKIEDILPKRLGFSLSPFFRPFVLVSPTSNIIRPSSKKFDTSMVIKSDELFEQIQRDGEKANLSDIFSGVAKLISQETLIEFSHRLSSYHKPITINYFLKFGIQPNQTHKKDAPASGCKHFCANCKKPISDRVAKYCFDNKERFGGKAYCFDCQKAF